MMVSKEKRKVLTRIWRNQDLCTLLVEMENGIATVRRIRTVLQKLKVELPYYTHVHDTTDHNSDNVAVTQVSVSG